MGKVIEIDFSAYKNRSKKNSVALNNTFEDTPSQDTFIDRYKNDYIQFYSELKQKDPLLYNFLEATKQGK